MRKKRQRTIIKEEGEDEEADKEEEPRESEKQIKGMFYPKGRVRDDESNDYGYESIERIDEQ